VIEVEDEVTSPQRVLPKEIDRISSFAGKSVPLIESSDVPEFQVKLVMSPTASM